jgi:hypothetical protein
MTFVVTPQPRQAKLRLQDVPGPQGIALAFTPWTLLDNDVVIEAGETDEAGNVTLHTNVTRGGPFTLQYPGRSLLVNSPSFDPVATVRGRQARLAALGYDVLVDGVDSDRTAAALRDFQRDHELFETGQPNPDTNAKLAELVNV